MFCLLFRISQTKELIMFSLLEKLHKCPWMVYVFLFLDISLGMVLGYFSASLLTPLKIERLNARGSTASLQYKTFNTYRQVIINLWLLLFRNKNWSRFLIQGNDHLPKICIVFFSSSKFVKTWIWLRTILRNFKFFLLPIYLSI